MGLADFINRLRFGEDEDDYDYDEDERDEYEEEEYREREISPRRSVAQTRTQARTSTQTQAQDKTRIFARPKVQTQNTNMEVVIVKPSSFEETKDICDHLLSGKTVFINMEGMHGELSKRIVDFVSGSVYSIKGNLQKIATYTIVATPANVELSGDFSDRVSNSYEMSGFKFKI